MSVVGSTQTPVASAARTVIGSTSTAAFSGYSMATILRAQLDVTAFAGTSPTLNVVIEDSLDSTNWNTIGTFAQRVAAGREVINVTIPFGDVVRVTWTIGGTTPSFTFSVVWTTQ